MIELKPCPCGQTPDYLDIQDIGQGTKWAIAVPGCCGVWLIEFRTHYYDFKSEECMNLAIEAWNDATRSGESLEKKDESISN